MRSRSKIGRIASRRGVAGGAVRRALALALAATAMAVVAGCGSSSGGGGTGASSGNTTTGGASGGHKPATIGLMVLDQKQSFFQQQIEMMTHLAESHGDKVTVLDAAGDPAKQLQIAQDWLNARKVDAMIGSTVDVNAFQPALDQAAKQGVPVVLTGYQPRRFQRAEATITQDFANWGQQIGEAAARCVNERLGGRGQVVILDNPEHPGTIVPTILQGIKDGLKSNPGARVVAETNGSDDTLKSMQAMQTVMEAHPGANTVVTATEYSVLGALQAYKVAGKDPKRLCLIGSGGTPEGAAAVRSGAFYAQVDLRFPVIYRAVMTATWALLANPDDPAYSEKAVPTQVGMNYAK